MKPPFRLVPDSLSHDTVELLEQLLNDARRGQILGLAFVAMMRRREFIANTAGEAHRNPTFARGMVAALDDHLSTLKPGGY
jgi:hypothetical protein